MQKSSAELSSAVNNKIWIKKWLNLEFPYFFNTLHFGQIQQFFEVLKADNTFNATWEPCYRSWYNRLTENIKDSVLFQST